MNRSWKDNNLLGLAEGFNIEEYLIQNEDGTYSLDLPSGPGSFGLGAFLRESKSTPWDEDTPIRNLIKKFIKDGRFTVKFKKWDGDFDISNIPMKSLEGAPEIVNGDFYAPRNKPHTTEGGIESLKGGPRVVTGKYNCVLSNLTSLEGAAERVESFICTSSLLTSFVGAPRIVEDTFHFAGGKDIKDLKGLPKKMERFVWINGPAEVESLEGLPEGVKYVDISYNSFKSLKGCPRSVRELHCQNNDLTSLEGVPEHLDYLVASFNYITTLESNLKSVKKNIQIDGNPLRDIGDNLEFVGGRIVVDEDANLSRLRRLAKPRDIRVSFSKKTGRNSHHEAKMAELGYAK